MPRRARIIIEGMPHHVIQRGNRRQRVFFNDQDKQEYIALLKKYCAAYNVEIWAYCLMDNHVHLVLRPSDRNGLAKAVGQIHWRYSLGINERKEWRGHLWQERFNSFLLHENYLRAVIRYVEINPVRAGIVSRPEHYQWSSARTHISGQKDGLLSDFYLLNEIKDWAQFLNINDSLDMLRLLRKHQSTGRPLGDVSFLKSLSNKLGMNLLPQKPGPKIKIELR